jgi:hypothetical protein
MKKVQIVLKLNFKAKNVIKIAKNVKDQENINVKNVILIMFYSTFM